jgi:hypothetical protein
VGLGTNLYSVKKRKFLTLPGLELRPLCPPARSAVAIPTELPRLLDYEGTTVVIYVMFFWELHFQPAGRITSGWTPLPFPLFPLSAATWYDSIFTAQIILGSAPEFGCQQVVSSEIVRFVRLAGRTNHAVASHLIVSACLLTSLPRSPGEMGYRRVSVYTLRLTSHSVAQGV